LVAGSRTPSTKTAITSLLLISNKEFITEVMDILTSNPAVEEVVVERSKPLRYAAENGNADMLFQALNP
jgi:short-subunit dehydrogenase involved in D-alanine esterification of teichoic acids